MNEIPNLMQHCKSILQKQLDSYQQQAFLVHKGQHFWLFHHALLILMPPKRTYLVKFVIQQSVEKVIKGTVPSDTLYCIENPEIHRV